jgi:HK97 family phage major capsid protein
MAAAATATAETVRTLKLKPQRREFKIERAGQPNEDGSIPVTFSSEYAVDRWYGREVLSHDPKAVRLDRMNDGGPLLLNHDSRQQVGVVVEGSAKIKGGQGQGNVRFSNSVQGQEIKRDVLEGIRRNMSVGYWIYAGEEERDGNNINFTATDWEPFELSLTPVPADPTIGVGRGLDAFAEEPRFSRENDVVVRSKIPAIAENRSTNTVAENPTAETRASATAGTVTVEQERERAANVIQTEQHRVARIRELCDAFNLDNMAVDFIRNGATIDTVQTEVLKKFREGHKPNAATGTAVTLSEKEQRGYSLSRAIRYLASQDKDTKFADADAGFEREVSQECAKKLRADPRGMYIPTNLRFLAGDEQQRAQAAERALKTTTSGAGGATVATELLASSFIDLLRNAMKTRALGITVLSDLQGNVAIPKQTGAGTLFWVSEASGADVTSADQAFGLVSLSPKTAQASTPFTRQLLAQSSIDIENFVRTDLVTINALGLDLAVINGSGASGQPLGILGQSGITVISSGTNGGALTYGNLVDAETALFNNNIMVSDPAWLTTPGVRGKARKTAKLANTIAEAIWSDDNKMLGYRSEVSNQVPNNLTKGTGTNLHAAILGQWQHAFLGEWGVLDLIADPYSLKKQGIIEVTSFVMVDVAVRYAVAFSVFKDIDPTL